MRVRVPKFNDLHVHFRQGATSALIRCSMQYCQHVLAMPNLRPPLVSPVDALDYRRKLASTAGVGQERVLVTIKATAQTIPSMLQEAKRQGVAAMKVYPAGVTTNAEDGIQTLTQLYPLLEEAQAADLIVCFHGEAPDMPGHYASKALHREQEFGRTWMQAIVRDFPRLRMVWEHLTTEYAVDFIRTHHNGNLVGTITAHHLLNTIDSVIDRKLSPLNYCLPVPKLETDRVALVEAATSCSGKFFLGSDSAPHEDHAKHYHGCAGCFTALTLPELLVEAFYEAGALVKSRALEIFSSQAGADFYGLSTVSEDIELEQYEWISPNTVQILDSPNERSVWFPVFRGGQRLTWRRQDGHAALHSIPGIRVLQ